MGRFMPCLAVETADGFPKKPLGIHMKLQTFKGKVVEEASVRCIFRPNGEFGSMTKQFTCGGLKVAIDDSFLECSGNRIFYVGSKEAVRTDLRKSHRILTAQDKTDRSIKSSYFSGSAKTG